MRMFWWTVGVVSLAEVCAAGARATWRNLVRHVLVHIFTFFYGAHILANFVIKLMRDRQANDGFLYGSYELQAVLKANKIASVGAEDSKIVINTVTTFIAPLHEPTTTTSRLDSSVHLGCLPCYWKSLPVTFIELFE
jgi:hypothetical protein